jgi:hypothetical protein
MKVIATMSRDTVLVSLSSKEIANIIGKPYLSSDDERDYLRIDKEFSLTERWESITRISKLPDHVADLRIKFESGLRMIEDAEKLCDTTTFTLLKQ